MPGIRTGVIDTLDNQEALPYEAGLPLKSLSIKVTSHPLLAKLIALDIPTIPAPTIAIFLDSIKQSTRLLAL